MQSSRLASRSYIEFNNRHKLLSLFIRTELTFCLPRELTHIIYICRSPIVNLFTLIDTGDSLQCATHVQSGALLPPLPRRSEIVRNSTSLYRRRRSAYIVYVFLDQSVTNSLVLQLYSSGVRLALMETGASSLDDDVPGAETRRCRSSSPESRRRRGHGSAHPPNGEADGGARRRIVYASVRAYMHARALAPCQYRVVRARYTRVPPRSRIPASWRRRRRGQQWREVAGEEISRNVTRVTKGEPRGGGREGRGGDGDDPFTARYRTCRRPSVMPA